jgi:hypothetical protein
VSFAGDKSLERNSKSIAEDTIAKRTYPFEMASVNDSFAQLMRWQLTFAVPSRELRVALAATKEICSRWRSRRREVY